MSKASAAPAAAGYRLFTRVKFSAEGLGCCFIGRIEEIRTPAEWPPGAELGRSLLQEWGVSRIALISYRTFPDQQYLLTVLEIDGKWFDSRRQEILLEIVGQHGGD